MGGRVIQRIRLISHPTKFTFMISIPVKALLCMLTLVVFSFSGGATCAVH